MKKLVPTTPIENCLPAGSRARWVDEHLKLGDSFGRPRDLVRIHTERLGRQSTTVVTDQRLWVWQRDLWTVFVGNRKGVCFEVPLDTTESDAWAAWRDYVKAMKGPCP